MGVYMLFNTYVINLEEEEMNSFHKCVHKVNFARKFDTKWTMKPLQYLFYILKSHLGVKECA